MIVKKLIEIVADQLNIDASTLSAETNIIKDIGADSLDIVDMLMTVERMWKITVDDEEVLSLKTIRDVADCIEKKTKK
ncbi:MAG: acyl carrier protein [Clostridiaceae bacterium]|jgi:acyl carrier protein|nr:acyl carrier protein [Clostridiaceae bacterium]